VNVAPYRVRHRVERRIGRGINIRVSYGLPPSITVAFGVGQATATAVTRIARRPAMSLGISRSRLSSL